MSPRRMDISSLLRDPSPPRLTDRPRTIDALLHHPPPAVLSVRNSPPRHRPPLPDSPAPTPLPHASALAVPPAQPRPFLGLDALVHVAAEERRRIALSDRDTPRFPDQDPRPTLPRDHDRPPAHHTYPPLPSTPLHRQPDLPSPHKRPRDAPPSPDHRLSQLTSPSTRLHSSASPLNNYPTLRRQLIDSTPSRSVPASLSVDDSRAIPPQHTSPFPHSHHPFQLPSHPSPRTIPPPHHSPQRLWSQLQSSPIQTPPLAATSDAMSPRYSHGPRMAGGIEVLSNEPSFTRDPRPDLSPYQTLGRDTSAERFVSDPRIDHARHEPSKLSPFSARAFPRDNNTPQPESLPHWVEGQERVSPREHLRSRFHLPRDPSADNNKSTAVLGHSLSECYPMRVCEEQPIVPDTSRHVPPPPHLHGIPDTAKRLSWPGADGNGRGERPAKESWGAERRQDVAENVSMSPVSKETPPHRTAISQLLASESPTATERNSLNLHPLSAQHRSPGRQARIAQTLHLDSPAPCVPASPILDFHLEDLEVKYDHQSKRSDTFMDTVTTAPFTRSDIPEPLLGKPNQVPGSMNADDVLVTDPPLRQPSPQLARPVLAKEPGMSVTSACSTVPHSKSGSPSQLPLSILSAVKDEGSPSPENVLISQLVLPEPSPRSARPKNTSERKLATLEQTTMDVDEELLSLVEDRPLPVAPTSSTMRAASKSPVLATMDHGAAQDSSDAPHDLLLGPPSQPILKGSVADEEKDRASMPPPTARNKKAGKDKSVPVADTVAGNKRKKDGTSKPAAKPKQSSKPRTKPAPKPKTNNADTSSKGSALKGVLNVGIRSRSTSVIPTTTDDVIPEPDVDNSDKEDDKLYCVCKTKYDEDRMMIACDRCDEWFHTLCVNMPDLEIDLVDQFICPPCIQKHPHLRTTWKRRCLFGLQHENPSSPDACHRPSRGAFSKYCSDDCGIKFMRAHITQWEQSGGIRDLLWESVKNATKREGVVVCAKADKASPPGMMDVDSSKSVPKALHTAAQRRAEREVTRLNVRLEEVVKEREFMKRELDMVTWREKVVELASERAGKVDECGWDQRLCFGEEEWADFGLDVLESYEDTRVKVELGDNAMPLDPTCTAHGEWWCTGKKKCDRHAGWQKLRIAEVSFDRETKEGILLRLTTREREIRKCIEDILYPQAIGTLQAPSKPTHADVQLNGPRSTSLIPESEKKRTL